MAPPTNITPTATRFQNPLSLIHIRWYAAGLGGLRISLGFIFFWAFIDKLFGLGYSTPSARAWINGGNPTLGYLNSSTGPLADFYHAIAGAPLTNVLFMAGLLGVGVALILGVGNRIAAVGGTLMLVLMWTSHPPWVGTTTNPFVDDHIVYAIVLLLFPGLKAGEYLGFGARWKETALVRRFPILA